MAVLVAAMVASAAAAGPTPMTASSGWPGKRGKYSKLLTILSSLTSSLLYSPYLLRSDFCDYFHHVDICRVRPEWAEVRARGSLMRGMPGGSGGSGGGSGGGGGVLAGHELTVFETTEVGLTLALLTTCCCC